MFWLWNHLDKDDGLELCTLPMRPTTPYVIDHQMFIEGNWDYQITMLALLIQVNGSLLIVLFMYCLAISGYGWLYCTDDLQRGCAERKNCPQNYNSVITSKHQHDIAVKKWKKPKNSADNYASNAHKTSLLQRIGLLFK